jgi:hypothetical protein
VRITTEGKWKARCAGLMAALVWHAVIIAALFLGARSGTSVLWKPDAHSADLLPPRSVITEVEIPLSRTSGTNQRRAPSGQVAQSKSAVHSLRLAEAQSENELRTTSESTVDAVSLPAVTGDVRIRCEVHIHQDVHGQVQAIDFGVCTGDQLWQRNLLEQLQQAARLIRPTENAVLAPVRTLLVDSDTIAPAILAAQLTEPAAASTKANGLLESN